MIGTKRKTRWGTWRWDQSCAVLIGPTDYEVDLDRCTTSAEVLDWIMQINGKSWATANCMQDLLDAIQDIIDPQATLCSGGVEQSGK